MIEFIFFFFKFISVHETINICVFFKQLRKAIEDVNSGNLAPNQTNEPVIVKKPLEPQEVPLLNDESNKNVQNTISSMDSALSNSDNCSDIEMGNMARPNELKK